MGAVAKSVWWVARVLRRLADALEGEREEPESRVNYPVPPQSPLTAASVELLYQSPAAARTIRQAEPLEGSIQARLAEAHGRRLN